MQPEKFDYFIKKPENETENPETCAICLSYLHEKVEIEFESSLKSRPYIKSLEIRKDEIMFTPCKHYFHIHCLVNWMHVKPECPTCRAKLVISF